ncbi:site-specific integrase [Microvirga subterranea]|uniref:Phage integrase family protein n=1 Tax=Microvirga subterranea TaxID=186651 RepID=A0A370HH43_9HYPH|nr:site-specific integrase [Microvirga subterranea]RDI57235.1 phage integrase family protein [Microvirga subterranea]
MRIHLREDLLPPSLSGPIRVDSYGLPRYWLTAWVALDGAGKSLSTQQRWQASIEKFYLAVERRLGSDCLDSLLADADLKRLATVLEGYFVELRNRGLDEGAGGNQAWREAYQFVRTTLERVLQTPNIPGMDALHERLNKLDKLYSDIKPSYKAGTKTLRALPSAVVEDLDELLYPSSRRNPFRSEDIAYRNFPLYKLLLHEGLRRSEGGILALDAIKEGIDPRTGEVRFWINVSENPYEPHDPRYARPGMKTPLSTRQIPISDELVSLIELYTENYRDHQSHSFLFASQKKKPLSLPMINLIFAKLSERLSVAAKKALWDFRRKESVTPHDLRHTCAVVRLTEFLDAGESMDVALAKLRAFFGWTTDSEMPRHYSRAYFEDRLATVWDRRLDAHIDQLRALESRAE